MRLFLSFSFTLLFCTNAFSLQQSSSSSSSSDTQPCGVDVRWLNTSGNLLRGRSSELPEDLSFLVHLSNGPKCTTAEVAVTVTYLLESQAFICSGTIRSAMNVSSQVQSFNISVRPFTQNDFLRWRNQPGARGEQQGKRLACMNLDGTADLGDTDRLKAGWMRISVGVIPGAGGLGVVEAMVRFQ